jgi:hypothetical protein
MIRAGIQAGHCRFRSILACSGRAVSAQQLEFPLD